MFKNFLIWLNSFFVKKKVGLYSTYVGNADIRNYIAEDPTTQVLLDSARLDLLKINNLEGYLKEIVQTSLKDISKKLVPNSGYDLVASERLVEMLQDESLISLVISTFKTQGFFVSLVNGSDEIPRPFFKVYLLESN